jgi:predicted transcriptional regulator
MSAIAPTAAAHDWRELRESHGLSVADLSELTGMHPATIERLENGGRCSESTRRFVLVALRDPEAVKAAIA